MRHFTTLILALSISLSISAQYTPDTLGEPFEQRTIESFDEAPATLIRCRRNIGAECAVLYIHGYNDYFFQREMAERFSDSLYSFYAIDLHKYGRSYREGQQHFEMEQVDEYFGEIDSAIEIIREEGAQKIILMGHSTGGLIASLYCDRDTIVPRVDALILNSPFLDMNAGKISESIIVPIVSILGYFAPTLEVLRDGSTAYFESLDSEHKGEWSYDTNHKLKGGKPITAGWIRAIHRAHNRIQSGLDIEIPTLLMYSDKSVISETWTPQHQNSDSVLDVKDIALYGDRLGTDVTHCQVKDGMHDLILSGYEAREFAYRSIFEWLKSKGLYLCTGSPAQRYNPSY